MYIIGIDVGGMSIKGGICNEKGEIIYKYALKTRKYDDDYTITKDIKKVIDTLLDEAKLSVKDISGIGIGQPGAVDSANGYIKYWNNILMHNVNVVPELKESFDLPIYINNDANCAALGEYVFGSGKGYSDIIFVTLGTGVGSGFILEGKLYEGRLSAGTEAGHMVIVSGGQQCNCGRKGCWEAYASATALMRQTREAMEKHPESNMHQIAAENGGVDGKTAFISAKSGDKAGLEVVNTYIGYIGEGLVNLANIFRPEVMIIGGGISYEGAYLTDKLNDMMNKLSFGAEFNPEVKVITADLKNDAGILGAVALVLTEINN